MPRATIRTDDGIVRTQEQAGLVEVRQFAVSKDDDTLQKKTILAAEDGCLKRNMFPPPA
jgi:hypothetical protein